MNTESNLAKLLRRFTISYWRRYAVMRSSILNGLVVWVKYGNWCKGKWEYYLEGYYNGNKIKFDRP